MNLENCICGVCWHSICSHSTKDEILDTGCDCCDGLDGMSLLGVILTVIVWCHDKVVKFKGWLG
jgi:hypothetical protein